MGTCTRVHLRARKGVVCQWGSQTGKTNIPCSFARFAENGVGGARGRSRMGQVGAKGRGSLAVWQRAKKNTNVLVHFFSFQLLCACFARQGRFSVNGEGGCAVACTNVAQKVVGVG